MNQTRDRVTAKPDIKVNLELVTPQKAAKWLKQNTHNRPLATRRASRIAGALKRGEFVTTAQGIGFDANGVLSDGQHRLHAIVMAEVSAWLIVVRNLSPDAQEVVDQGKARSLGEVLGLRKEQNANALAATLRVVYSLQEFGTLGSVRLNEVTPQQLIGLLDGQPEIREVVSPIRRARDASGIRFAAGAWGALHYEFSRRDERLAASVLAALSTGESFPSNAIRLLHRFLLKQSALPAGRRVGWLVQGHAMVKAWNATATGQDLQQLKVDRREDVPEIAAPSEVLA